MSFRFGNGLKSLFVFLSGSSSIDLSFLNSYNNAGLNIQAFHHGLGSSPHSSPASTLAEPLAWLSANASQAAPTIHGLAVVIFLSILWTLCATGHIQLFLLFHSAWRTGHRGFFC